ncbi:hypothetical protein LBMAG42_02530 [Deltaproteobacteria bacterium]|nr:hypothetical protein LBMAG42_02530 [Deltaproteobacteria bacterium]
MKAGSDEIAAPSFSDVTSGSEASRTTRATAAGGDGRSAGFTEKWVELSCMGSPGRPTPNGSVAADLSAAGATDVAK